MHFFYLLSRSFSPDRFKEYLSAEMKVRTDYTENSDGSVDIKWYDSKEMVESALAAQR